MPGLGISFIARRARSSWLLLACVAFTVLLATGLAAVLWTFAAGVIPSGARSILADPQGRVIGLSGLGDAGQAASDSALIRTTLRKAWPGVGFQMERALWANPVQLPPPRAGAPVVAQVQVATLPGIRSQAVLTAGKWPGPPRPGGPLPVALPVTAASQLRLAPGSVLKDTARSGPASAGLLVTGLFRPRNPASPYWALDLVPVSGISTHPLPGMAGIGAQGSFVSYGPAVVNPAAFGTSLAATQASWFVLPQASALARGKIGALAGSTAAAVTKLATAVLPDGLQVATRFPQVLAGIASTIVLSRSLFTIAALQLLLVATAGLVLAARLLASLREEEAALLRARGATRWQVVRPVLAEAVAVGVVAGVAGVLIGTRLTGVLAGAAKVRLDGSPAGGITALSWLSALAMLVLTVAILTWPALHTLTPDAARIRQGRQGRLAGIAWAGGDLAVVALAVLAVWELRGYSAVAHPAAGALGIDPVVAVAPALALAGVALVPLRALPLAARLSDKATEHGRRLATAMVSWQIARRPIRQAGPVLLVVVAAATTTLALAGYASWRRSAADQAAFAVGSDVQVNSVAPAGLGTTGAITGAPGVTAATPASLASIGNGGQLIALDASTAAQAIMLRPDLSGLPLSALWRQITPRRPPGLALPGRPERLEILAALSAGPPGRAGTGPQPLGGVLVQAWIQGADGATYELSAGFLPAGGRQHPLAVSLAGAGRASYPLRLLGLTMTYPLPAFDPADPLATVTARLAVQALAVAGRVTGPFGAPFRRGAALAAWQVTAMAPSVPTRLGAFGVARPQYGTPPAIRRWQRVAAGGRQVTFTSGHAPSTGVIDGTNPTPGPFIGSVAIMAQPRSEVVPVIATSGYLAATRLQVGFRVPVSLDGFSVTLQIVASVARFPTVFGQNRALIADLGTISALLAASQVTPPLPVTRWWLRTRDGRVPRLPAGLSVAVRARQRQALLSNALLTAPRQAILAIGIAAVLLGGLGFSVSVAASLRGRRTQSAVFAALGVGRGAQARQLCLEQCVLSIPAAAAGLLAGIGLARLLVPAITLTTDAASPVPPALVILPLGQAVALALVIAAAPAVAAAVSVWRRPDPAAQLRAEAR